MRIGFIGLGIMGKPMSKNLIKAGYEVVCYNRSRAKVDEVVAAGGIPADSIAEVAQKCDVVITMLPDSPEVKEVALGPGGILENAVSGSILIDMSSIAPLASREISEKLAAKGMRMIDAPVSGGEAGAINGTLSVMAGGTQADFDEVKPILEKMAASVVRVGDIGAGNIAKLANQTIVAVNIAVLAEALTLAAKAGADPAVVFQAIRGGLAGSKIMEAKAPMMLEHNIKPGFKLDLHIKDLKNVQETGHSINLPMPLVAQVMEMMQSLKVDDLGDADHSALVRFYEKISGVSL